MAHLDITVADEQVRMATREVLPSTETMFTKEECVQFLELLQVELLEHQPAHTTNTVQQPPRSQSQPSDVTVGSGSR